MPVSFREEILRKVKTHGLCADTPGKMLVSIKDRPGSLFQPGPGPGSAKSAGTGILPGPGLKFFLNVLNFPKIFENFLIN